MAEKKGESAFVMVHCCRSVVLDGSWHVVVATMTGEIVDGRNFVC